MQELKPCRSECAHPGTRRNPSPGMAFLERSYLFAQSPRSFAFPRGLFCAGIRQCGEQVEVAGRYQGFFSVRTANGEAGYIGEGSLVLLKDRPGAKAPLGAAPQAARPRTAYDEPSPAPPANPVPAGFDLMLPNNTPIHLKLSKTVSSETAHVGDVVDLVVAEDVVLDGLCVIAGGASAEGVVTE